jgi:hypothetical protein
MSLDISFREEASCALKEHALDWFSVPAVVVSILGPDLFSSKESTCEFVLIPLGIFWDNMIRGGAVGVGSTCGLDDGEVGVLVPKGSRIITS